MIGLRYLGADGTPLGTFSLYSGPGEAEGQTDYYLKTERTRVLGKVPAASASRVGQDLEQLFSAAP